MDKPKILLVEDNQSARVALAAILVERGYEVKAAESGLSALLLLSSFVPDLVITDLALPGASGMEVIKRVRETPAFMDVPIVIVSGHDAVELRVHAFDLGADDFVPKPVDTEDLLARVRRHLRRAARQKAVAQESVIDGLTGVLNRKGISNFFARELERAPRESVVLSVIMIDLDGFKAINDKFGHAAGDTALCAVSRALQDSLRATDRVGRIGGDEFLAVLPGASATDLQPLIERLRALVPIRFSLSHEVDLDVTFSLGAATAHNHEELETLLARADQAMYEDKRIRHVDEAATKFGAS